MLMGVLGCAVLVRDPDGVSGWATEPFFPQASPWKVAFWVSLTVLVILLLGAGCYTKREHSLKVQEMREKEILCQAREQDRQTKEEVLKDTGKAGQGSRLVHVAASAEREEQTTVLSPGLWGNPSPAQVAGETWVDSWSGGGSDGSAVGTSSPEVTNRGVVFCEFFFLGIGVHAFLFSFSFSYTSGRTR